MAAAWRGEERTVGKLGSWAAGENLLTRSLGGRVAFVVAVGWLLGGMKRENKTGWDGMGWDDGVIIDAADHSVLSFLWAFKRWDLREMELG